MTAVVGRENAKSAFLTGTAGVLVLSIAFVMMVLAAPSRPHVLPQGTTSSAQTLSQVTQIAPPAVTPAGSPSGRRVP